jgi:hypothetical protein
MQLYSNALYELYVRSQTHSRAGDRRAMQIIA